MACSPVRASRFFGKTTKGALVCSLFHDCVFSTDTDDLEAPSVLRHLRIHAIRPGGNSSGKVVDFGEA